MKSLIVMLSISLLSCFANIVVAEDGVTVFCANGMFNTNKELMDSCGVLEDKIRAELPEDADIIFKLSYNQQELEKITDSSLIDYGAIDPLVDFTATAIGQLFEVAVQKGTDAFDDKIGSFFDWMGGVEIAPDWFQDAMKELSLVADNFSYVIDADLHDHVALYNNELGEGRKVIVVCHSQGCFYANRAYDLVSSEDFGIVAVATPSDYVAGDGEHIILTSDWVINEVVRGASLYQVLEANTTNNTSESDWTGHSFVNSYLAGDVSGPKIVGHVVDLIEGEVVDEPPVVEPPSGNSFSTATPISIGTVYAKEIDSSADVDYFVVTAESGGTINVVLTNLSADLDLELYDSGQNFLDTSWNGGAQDEEISYDSDGVDTYYIKVVGWEGAISSYDLEVTFESLELPLPIEIEGVTVDMSTGLMWQDNDYETKSTWIDASEYCGSLTLGENSNWRLPSVNELFNLYLGRDILLSYETSDSYWSSSLIYNGPVRGWTVSFADGSQIIWGIFDYNKYVRCVRSGQ